MSGTAVTRTRRKVRYLPAPEITPDVIARFWHDVKKSDGCWEKGNGASRPIMKIGAHGYTASNISFFIHTGRYPTEYVCHSCDNPLCVRPDHLFEGTARENTLDMVRKGRAAGRLQRDRPTQDIREWLSEKQWAAAVKLLGVRIPPNLKEEA